MANSSKEFLTKSIELYGTLERVWEVKSKDLQRPSQGRPGVWYLGQQIENIW
jgi:hypothetical protein